MTCPVASAAPQNDMVLWNTCKQFAKTDKVCSAGAIKALSRHLWYLTEELVLLSLFSQHQHVSDSEKDQIVAKLKEHPSEVALIIIVPNYGGGSNYHFWDLFR